MMTVLLLNIVGVWNNYFLPLIIFSQNQLYPLTVGLGLWSQRAQNSGNAELFPLVVIGGLVTIVPLIALFLILQRYWRSGLLLGSIANCRHREGRTVAVSTVTLEGLTKVYPNGVEAVQRPGPAGRRRRVRRPGRPVRLRQDHGAAHGGRPGGDHGRHRCASATRWSTTCRRGPAGRGHGVPELRAVPAPDRAPEHRRSRWRTGRCRRPSGTQRVARPRRPCSA